MRRGSLTGGRPGRRSHALRGEDTDDLPAKAQCDKLPIGGACEVDQFATRQEGVEVAEHHLTGVNEMAQIREVQ